MLKKITNLNNWLILIFFPISILSLILIFVLKPFLKIRLGNIRSDRFGHYIKNFELYLCDKKKNPKKFLKTFDIFFLSLESSNLYFKNICKKYIRILPAHFFILTLKIAEKSSFFKKNILDFRDYDYDPNNHFDSANCQIKLNEEEIQAGEKILEQVGINANDKIVCLSVRDDMYMKKNNKTYDPDHNWKFRNSDLENYKLASNELTKLGYKVVRVGKDTELKISFENEKIFDYSKSKIRSDFLDIYLAYRCAFAFGDSSAWMTAPMAFRKHLAYANYIPFSHLHYYSNKFTYIFKYYFDEKLKKRLNINEIFERKLHYLYSKELKKSKIKIKDNSPEDILRLVLEVESKYTGKFKKDPENELRNKNFKFFLNNNAFLKKNLNNSFELKSSCEKYFLKNNFYTN
jgi:putative glycosyltransferase (TIGR04372 family)